MISRKQGSLWAMVLIGALIGGCVREKEPVPQAASPQAAAPVKVYAATAGFPRPFTFVDESGNLTGHNIELIEAVFAKLPQYQLQWEVTDFPSMFAGMDAGRYQIAVNNFAENEERKEKYLFSDPIFVNRYVAAVAADNTDLGDEIKTFADLSGKTCADSVGTNMATAIEKYNKDHPEAPIKNSYTEADILMVLREVESGKWDFNLIDKPMFDAYKREFDLNLKGIELAPAISGELMKTPYSYLLIGKGNEALAGDINRALRELIVQGTSKRINEKYFASDYSPELP
ncbi:MAG: transporter substrate-binding domain-containing protein [Spirochaetaceae bacterium]|jgi:polar amino acid transport system substrate-binding protein|nr:transporter substrate-binding domain-containing protein [Spirochaetaceae bacterium]